MDKANRRIKLERCSLRQIHGKGFGERIALRRRDCAQGIFNEHVEEGAQLEISVSPWLEGCTAHVDDCERERERERGRAIAAPVGCWGKRARLGQCGTIVVLMLATCHFDGALVR